jgi:uncharacterized protein YwlG (UPF0340 family)
MCVDGRRNSFQAGDAIFVLLCSYLEKRGIAIVTAYAARCDSMNKLITAEKKNKSDWRRIFYLLEY